MPAFFNSNTVKPRLHDDTPRKKSGLLATGVTPRVFATRPDAPKPGPVRRMFSTQLRDLEDNKRRMAIAAEKKANPVQTSPKAPPPVKRGPGRPAGVKKG
jgi:hypothetical protein